MVAINKVIRLALSDAGSTAALGVNLTNDEITAKQEAGIQGLLLKGSVAVGGVCHDYSGNIYVTDWYRHCILKIDEGGRISIFSGLPGTSGDVLATTDIRDARYNDPRGIVCDKSGNIYVADKGNSKIKIINSKGVNVLAGSSVGNVDGNGSTAKFNKPYGIAVDKAGTVYVADTGNHSLRRVRPNGDVLTLAGSGTAGDSENVQGNNYTNTFSSPEDLTVDPQGNVYILDTGNVKIKKYTVNGWVYLHSGTGVAGNSLGTASASTTYAYTCTYETLVSCDADESGNIYVIDNGNNGRGNATRLVKVDYNGRPGNVANFGATTSNLIVNAVMCTPGQKLLVTISNSGEDNSSSSSMDSSSSSSVDSSSTSSSSSSSGQ